jgi:hypothetical protein
MSEGGIILNILFQIKVFVEGEAIGIRDLKSAIFRIIGQRQLLYQPVRHAQPI